MSENLPSPYSDPNLSPVEGQGGALGAPFEHFERESEESGASLGRYVDALQRYKWAIVLVVCAGIAIGAVLAKRTRPMYVAQSTVWIETEGGRQSRQADLVEGGGLLQSTAWVDLLLSHAVLEPVVFSQRLYLDYGNAADSAAFRGFVIADRFRPGIYRLVVSEDGSTYRLEAEDGMPIEVGTPGDSIGEAVGFVWAPPAGQLTPERVLEFSVISPRDASVQLQERIRPDLPQNYANFMRLELSGRNPERIARTLNGVADRFVEVATDLKRAKLVQLTGILDEQLRAAQASLQQAEMELEGFRVQTITLPSEASPVVPGLTVTQDPAFQSFFAMRIEREQLRRDADAIRSALQAQAEYGATPAERLWTIESVQESSDLRTALSELTEKQAELRALRTRYTDEHADVDRLARQVASLETVTVPALAATLLSQIQARDDALEAQIGSAGNELRQIPPRMIEEARLTRRVAIADQLFTSVQARYESARLAAVSATPDVRVLDVAVAPSTPTNSGAARTTFAIAVLASIGLAIGGALVLDRFDRRVRYPTQITDGMGLPILGAIQLARADASPGSDTADQVVEAFRELRLAVMAAYGHAGPLMLTVTSPGSGDGKSFVSSNLALAFADLGYRTLLIDGDIRRGTLHNVLGGTRKPGLTDYLAGEITEATAIQRTEYPNVDFIGAGAWRRTGPELLASPNMRALLANMRSVYKVIIVDSSPLGAGVDPYVLGTVTGSLLMVLRTGATDRDLAGAKLDTLQRLPIRVLGAVMNAVPSRGMYRYYSYLSNYQLPPGHEDREPAGATPG